jgi:hypothetical protein
MGLASRFATWTENARNFLRELVRAERLEDAPEEQLPRGAGRKPAFSIWLLQRETLPSAAPGTSPAPTREPTFLQILLAREHLPVDEQPPAAQSGAGFLRGILARERFPCCAVEDATAREPGFLARLLEREALPRDPVLPTDRGPSFLRRLLSSESLEERDDERAD